MSHKRRSARHENEHEYYKVSSIKTLPPDAKIIQVEETDTIIRNQTPRPTQPPTRRQITDVDEMEMEARIARRNKRHHQRIHYDKCPAIQPASSGMSRPERSSQPTQATREMLCPSLNRPPTPTSSLLAASTPPPRFGT